jgi:hypothetical protein
MSVKIAYVKWIDSTSRGAIHKDDKAIEDDYYIESSGLIVSEDKEVGIRLALHLNWKQDHYTQDIFIPKEAIKRIRRLKID